MEKNDIQVVIKFKSLEGQRLAASERGKLQRGVLDWQTLRGG